MLVKYLTPHGDYSRFCAITCGKSSLVVALLGDETAPRNARDGNKREVKKICIAGQGKGFCSYKC